MKKPKIRWSRAFGRPVVTENPVSMVTAWYMAFDWWRAMIEVRGSRGWPPPVGGSERW